jgi:hypothetical protein
MTPSLQTLGQLLKLETMIKNLLKKSDQSYHQIHNFIYQFVLNHMGVEENTGDKLIAGVIVTGD